MLLPPQEPADAAPGPSQTQVQGVSEQPGQKTVHQEAEPRMEPTCQELGCNQNASIPSHKVCVMQEIVPCSTHRQSLVS